MAQTTGSGDARGCRASRARAEARARHPVALTVCRQRRGCVWSFGPVLTLFLFFCGAWAGSAAGGGQRRAPRSPPRSDARHMLLQDSLLGALAVQVIWGLCWAASRTLGTLDQR